MSPRKKPLEVFCLEGEWAPDKPHTRPSVRPMLELLEDQGLIRFFHRDVATRTELTYHLNRWTSDAFRGFRFGYLAFHGQRATLDLNDDLTDEESEISLDDLGELLKGRCASKVVHFSSCSVVDVGPQRLAEFRSTIKARAVSGYRKEIEWMPSAALDLLYISSVAEGSTQRIDVALRNLLEHNNVLARHLGFMIAA